MIKVSNTADKYIVGKFDKVLFEDFKISMIKHFPTYQWKEGEMEELYEGIQLPKRADGNASGYDFFAPFRFEICPGTSVTIPTGVYMDMNNPWMLIGTPIEQPNGIIVTIEMEDAEEPKIENPYLEPNEKPNTSSEESPKESYVIENLPSKEDVVTEESKEEISEKDDKTDENNVNESTEDTTSGSEEGDSSEESPEDNKEENETPKEEEPNDIKIIKKRHVIVTLSIPPENRCPAFLSAVALYGTDIRFKPKSYEFKAGDPFFRATLVPYGITYQDEYDESNEHVDEVKIVRNFKWSEELYPGSVDPNYDGSVVTVMIIDDGYHVTYDFTLTEINEISDDEISSIFDEEELPNNGDDANEEETGDNIINDDDISDIIDGTNEL